MTITLIAFLFLYLLFVLAWLIFSLIALYHMIKYGQVNITTFFTIIIYLAGAIAILYLSYIYLCQIDWSAGLTVFQGGAGMFGANIF